VGFFPKKTNCISLEESLLYSLFVRKLSAAKFVRTLTVLSNGAQMVSGNVHLNVNFVRKMNHPLAWQRHHHFGNPTHALFISQWWHCSMKFITTAI